MPARYQLFSDGSVGFALGSYDAHQPLTIDPMLVYSSYLGGSGADAGTGIAVDSAGNIYVSGSTRSPNFPRASPIQSALGGGYDLFVTKLNPTGTALIYSTYLGGSVDDTASKLVIDRSSNVYLTGSTSSANFPTADALDGIYNGGLDAFLTKISPAGDTLVYSTYLGTANRDEGLGLTVDTVGKAYVVGTTTHPTFLKVSPLQETNGGGSDLFVTRFSSDGSALGFSTLLGGGGNEHALAVAVDGTSNIYVTGWSESSNFPLATARQPTSGGARDAIVVKINPTAKTLVYSSYLGGSGLDQGNGLVIDSTNNIYLTGTTASANFPTASPLQSTRSGASDAFVTKLNPTGQTLLFSTYLGGSTDEEALDVALDSSSNIMVIGKTSSTNFPTTDPVQASNAGLNDVFVTKLNNAGTTRLFSSYLGGPGDDGGSRLALSGVSIYLTGYTYSARFPVVGAYQSSPGGAQDAFVARISTEPARFDVRMRDTASDNGSEPQPSNSVVWSSPDILPCATRNCTQPESPVTGSTNYVYVTLRNNGPKVSPPQTANGTLRLYYTKSGGAAAWPTDWTPIGSAAVTLAPSEVRPVEIAWSNVPAPGHYCLLARWESSIDPMTPAETSNTLLNTRNSNNIVWRNVNVISMPRGGTAQSTLVVRNIASEPVAIDLEISPSGTSFLAQGTLEIDLGSELFNGWDQGGRQGSNVEAIGGTRVRITSVAGSELRYIVLGAGRAPEASLRFSANPSALPNTYTLYLRQYVQGTQSREEIGGVAYQLTIQP